MLEDIREFLQWVFGDTQVAELVLLWCCLSVFCLLLLLTVSALMP